MTDREKRIRDHARQLALALTTPSMLGARVADWSLQVATAIEDTPIPEAPMSAWRTMRFPPSAARIQNDKIAAVVSDEPDSRTGVAWVVFDPSGDIVVAKGPEAGAEGRAAADRALGLPEGTS